MKTAKELKALYLKELEINSRWREDQKMKDYCYKKASVVVELQNGGLYEISKPTIETNFCFGYWTDRTGESYKNAQEQAENARKDIDHFMNENLSNFNKWIKSLEEAKESGSDENGSILYILDHEYNGDKEECKLRGIRWLGRHLGYNPDNLEQVTKRFGTTAKKATKEDIEALINGYKEARDLFKKRLETYLKRFGLSCINSRSYDVDY